MQSQTVFGVPPVNDSMVYQTGPSGVAFSQRPSIIPLNDHISPLNSMDRSPGVPRSVEADVTRHLDPAIPGPHGSEAPLKVDKDEDVRGDDPGELEHNASKAII